uniref:Uncharacterized protein n=1 Tax=Anguilla anguilla TaxID=7936 RepID=A0A0E9XTI2_ANGAN
MYLTQVCHAVPPPHYCCAL